MKRLHTSEEPVYSIGVAARLLGISPQTLRLYEAHGLIEPARSPGGTRLYSEADLRKARRIVEMCHTEGINIAGVKALLAQEEAQEEAGPGDDALRDGRASP